MDDSKKIKTPHIYEFIKQDGYSNINDASCFLPSSVETFLEVKSKLKCCEGKLTPIDLLFLWKSGQNTALNETGSDESKLLHNSEAGPDVVFSQIFSNSCEIAFILGYLRFKTYELELPLTLLKKYNGPCNSFKLNKSNVINMHLFNMHSCLENGISVHQYDKHSISFVKYKSDTTVPLLKSYPLLKKLPLFFNRESNSFAEDSLKLIDSHLRTILNKNNDNTLYFNEEYSIISERPSKTLPPRIKCIEEFLINFSNVEVTV